MALFLKHTSIGALAFGAVYLIALWCFSALVVWLGETEVPIPTWFAFWYFLSTYPGLLVALMCSGIICGLITYSVVSQPVEEEHTDVA